MTVKGMAIEEADGTAPARRGGRPTRRDAEECLKRILTISQRHFLKQGYTETSLDCIAREAGVAKKTLYHHFGSKAGLFTELVANFRRTWVAALSDIVLTPGPLEKVLTAVACHLLDMGTRPERVKLHRLLLLEARRFPKLVRIVYDRRGALCGMEPMANFLRNSVAAEKLAIDDVDLATEQFVHIVLGGIRERVTMGVMRRPDATERRRIARQAAGIFLSGVRVAPSGSGRGRHVPA